MSVHATSAQVIAFAIDANGTPELTSSASLDTIVAAAALIVTLDVWGAKLYFGHLTLAAHMGVVGLTPDKETGMTTSRRIGQLAESFGTAPLSDAELSRTKWGRLHLTMRTSLTKTRYRSTGSTRGHILPDGRVI